MATFIDKGTEFTLTILPLKIFSKRDSARIEICIKNEYVSYRQVYENIIRTELEEGIFKMFRLLAGAYKKEYNVAFENTGIALDLCPYTENGGEVSRQRRRENDCVAAMHLLLKSRDNKCFFGGVYSFVLHREELEKFARELRAEFEEAYRSLNKGKGKYLFVGVSPEGFSGCNYWYLDPTKTVRAGDSVWVRMGKHNTEQIAYVDSVRYYDEDNAPYDPQTVKRILKKAEE